MRSPSTSFWSHSHAGAFSTSPAQNTRSSEVRSCFVAGSVPYRMRRRTPAGHGGGMVEPSLVGDGGAAHEERAEDDVAVADDPADVGRRPPDVARPQAE